MAVRMTTLWAALLPAALLACLPAAASVQAPAQPAVSLQPAAAPTYQGKPVSLHFQNIEVRALLQVIADFTGLNVVTSDAVTGQVSVRLRDVPWDQALDIVLQMRGLAMQRRGNVIWVAPRSELAERERQQLETSSAMQGLEPLRTQVFALNYARAADVVRHLAGSGQPAATRMLSTRGSAFAEARTNQLFVTDVPGVLQQVQELLAQLDIPVRQVMIEARIVEAGDSWGRSLGARLALVGQGHGGGMHTGVGDHRIGLASRAGQAETALYKLPAAGLNGFDAATLGLSLFSPAAARFLTLEISALEADGKGQLISSPRVVTADQSKALIEQGTELPYQVATASGATSLAFRKANLKLEVIPRITPEGQVLLDLDVNKDSVGRATTNGHAVDTKHVQTHVLVEDGGTVVIGGIFELNEREDVTKVPVLGDIPVVGELFRQRTQTREKREMLVFITPRILDGRNAAKAPATQGETG